MNHSSFSWMVRHGKRATDKMMWESDRGRDRGGISPTVPLVNHRLRRN